MHSLQISSADDCSDFFGGGDVLAVHALEKGYDPQESYGLEFLDWLSDRPAVRWSEAPEANHFQGVPQCLSRTYGHPAIRSF